LDIRLNLPASLQVVFRYAFNLSWRCRSDAIDREAVAMESGWDAVRSQSRKVGKEWHPKEAPGTAGLNTKQF
jgi:cation transport regulator ChaB